MSDSIRVAVAGATGALGRELLVVLDKAPWRPEQVVPLASRASAVPFVDYGGDQVAVDVLEEHPLDDVHAVLLAVSGPVGGPSARRALEAGVPVVDCSGGAVEGVPLVVPWVNPEALPDALARGIVATPGAPALLVSSVVGPLRRAGLTVDAEATVFVPASTSGRDGIEELSRQVVALFSQGTPPRRVFEQGLAFDLLPQLGEREVGGWTDREVEVGDQIAALVGHGVTATLVGVPLFSGMAATLRLHLDSEPPLEVIRQVLEQGGTTVVDDSAARLQPRPRKVEGQPFVHVARIRRDARTSAVHLWAVMDNLRASATVAVACCGAFVRS